MEELREQYRQAGNIHHAYVIEGGRAASKNALVDFLESDLDVLTRGNADYWSEDYDSMGIDEARSLRDMQSRRALGGGRKIFVISADFITHEAQNALLKVLEEPTEGTHIFMIVPSSAVLLPTLLSRVVHIRREGSARAIAGGNTDASAFLAMNQAERSEALKRIIGEKDKQAAAEFVGALEREYRNRINLLKARKSEIFALSELERVRVYLGDRSPSVKQLLEHVSVVVPKIA